MPKRPGHYEDFPDLWVRAIEGVKSDRLRGSITDVQFLSRMCGLGHTVAEAEAELKKLKV